MSCRCAAALAMAGLALGLLACGAREAGPAAAGGAVSPEESGAALVLRLDEEAVTRVGVRTAPAERGELAPEVLAYGRVLDPAPASGALANLAAARAASDAAERERVRVQGLARDGENASARDLESARAAAARAQADLELADFRVDAVLGAARGAFDDLEALARRLGRRQVALVRVDVPGGGERPQPERGATLMAYPELDRVLSAQYLGLAPDADPSHPGWAFAFLVDESPPPPGSRVRARLALGGEPLSGVRVPESALLRSEGRLYVFVALGGGRFERRPIEGHALPEGGAFATSGLAAGEPVVVAGAQQLLSTQRLAAGGGEQED